MPSRQPRPKRATTGRHTTAATASTSTVASVGHHASRRIKSPSRPRGLPQRAKSTNSKPSKPQTRTLRQPTTATPLDAPLDTLYSSETITDSLADLSIASGPSHAPASSKVMTRSRAMSAPRQCKTMEDIARVILAQSAKNIVVMVGAGISTASGIPDFRTPGTGLYDNLKQYRIPTPQSIFDIEYFECNPKPFYTLAKELYPTGRYRPNYAHYFIRLLHDKGLLLRVYTQNIDGLERMSGVPAMKIVEAHGTFLTSSCIKCSQKHPSETVKAAVFNDKVPRCQINKCMGLVKPNIVFFGEDLPRRFYYYLKDFPQADLLLVMGTSLEVEPFAGIVDAVRFFVPRMLMNREAVGPFRGRSRARGNDVVAKGDLIRQIRRFTDILGWTQDINALIDEAERRKGYTVPKYEADSSVNAPGTSTGKKTSSSPPGGKDTSTPSTSSPANPSDKKVVLNHNNNSVTAWGVRTGLPPSSLNHTAKNVNGVGRSSSSNSSINSAKQQAEIVALKNMVHVNHPRAVVHKSASASNLPKIVSTDKCPTGTTTQQPRPKPFHAQTTMFRTVPDSGRSTKHPNPHPPPPHRCHHTAAYRRAGGGRYISEDESSSARDSDEESDDSDDDEEEEE